MNGTHRWTAALLALATGAVYLGCGGSDSGAFCEVYDETNAALGAAMEPRADFASLDEAAQRADLEQRLDRVREIYRQRQAVAPENIRDDFQVLIDGLELGSPPQDSAEARLRVRTASENIGEALSRECGIRLPATTDAP